MAGTVIKARRRPERTYRNPAAPAHLGREANWHGSQDLEPKLIGPQPGQVLSGQRLFSAVGLH
jgi:hypothetical protein